MKKTIFTSSAIILLAALACSNEKDPQPAPKSRTDLLTSHEWQLDYAIKANGDTVKITEECKKDERAFFGKDGSYQVKTYVKCTDESDLTGTWKFLDNETKIIISKNLSGGIKSDTGDISILDDQIFEIRTKVSVERLSR